MAPPQESSGAGLCTLYVGDLHADVTELHLQEKFSTFGPITMIHVCRDSMTRRSLGYAYVNFFNSADAQNAMDKLNYTEIRGRCCRIMWNNRDRRVRASPEANIFVKNLDPSIDSRALYETFSIFGHILSCKVATDLDGSSRGYGFVQYESEDAAKQAIERVNGMMIGNRMVFVGPVIKQSRGDENSDCAVYVRNLPATWDDIKVQAMFKEHGELASSLLMNDARSGKNYAFVNFKEPAAAQKAIEALNGMDTRTEEEKAAMEAEEAEKKAKKAEEEAAAEAKEDGAEPKEAAEDEKKEEEGEKKAEEEGEATDKDKKKEGSPPMPNYLLYVGRSKTRAERDDEANARRDQRQSFEGIKLCIRNLPRDATDQSLKALFTEFGTVTDVKAVLDRETGECKGYGFVRFATMEEASKGVAEMHLKEAIPGYVLQVDLAAGKGERDKGSGKGKGDGKGKGKGKGFGGKGGKGGMQAPWMDYPMGNAKGSMPPYGGMPGKGMPPPAMYYPMGPGGPMQGPPLGGQMARPMYPMQMYPGMMPGMQGMQMMRPNMMPPAYPQGKGMAPMPGPGGAPQPGAPAPGQKQMLGEKLFPVIQKFEPAAAGKITGMLLEMDEGELVKMLESEAYLQTRVAEAKRVLGQ